MLIRRIEVTRRTVVRADNFSRFVMSTDGKMRVNYMMTRHFSGVG